MKKSLIASAVLLALGGCGGGGGSNGSDDVNSLIGVAGYTLPTEISAVPASNSSTSTTGVRVSGFQALLRGVAASDLPADSDYQQTQPKKYVEERALEQFDIIETILNALGQTNYALPENVGQGPYTAIVAWEEQEEGRQTKMLQPWVVESSMIEENGQLVNRVRVWIEEPDMMNSGQTITIRAEFKIYRSATVNDDGSYADYGEWDLNVSFADDNSAYFAASSRIDEAGVNTIKIHDASMPMMGPNLTVPPLKGILVRSGNNGYGKVSYPDYEFCMQSMDPNCTIPSRTAAYAYNQDYLVVDDDLDTSGDEVYKSRDLNQAVEISRRYGLFYTDADAGQGIAAGDNVEKHKNFGFPIVYTDGNGVEMYAYYGAWQGRHEIWGGESFPDGVTVKRVDLAPGEAQPTYTVSKIFPGTLTRRMVTQASLNDILGVPVEIFIGEMYELFYNSGSGQWEYCDGIIDWGVTPPRCTTFDGLPSVFQAFTDYELLLMGEADRKFVDISRWDNGNIIQYVYLDADPGNGIPYSGPGFYPAQMNMEGRLEANGPIYTPSDGDQLMVNISGSLYIEYTDDFSGGKTGWVEKALVDFDEETWTPVFDDQADRDFVMDRDGEYYISNNGVNYVVRRIADADAPDSYEVVMELQRTLNPANADSFLPPGTAYLTAPWEPDVRFTLVTDPANPDFLQLVYATDDPATPEDETGNVFTQGMWGLQAYDNSGNPLDGDGNVVAVDSYGVPTGSARPAEFNWEYAEGGGWGSQRYLMDGSNYVILSDPIQLLPIDLTNGAGETKTVSLQFDGWMMGLPDLYDMLAMNDFQISQEIKDKAISIPEGTLVTDANDGTTYYVKPLEISVFLAEVPASTAGLPTLDAANTVDLNSVPDFVDHGMGAMPENTTVKYSEGLPVE